MSAEREVKLAAPAGYQLPELEMDGVLPSPVEERRFATVYVDTDDLRIARWGCSLRHRELEGWTLKLPPTEEGALIVRDERRFPGDARRPPADAVNLLTAYLRGVELRPVVRLRTLRRRSFLRTDAGEPLGEVVDDEVSVMDGRRVAARFREVEVEVTEAATADLLDAVVARLRSAGAGPVANVPKYLHALGARAGAPAEVVVHGAGPGSTVAEVVRDALAGSVIRLLRHDAGVRSGEEPEDLHQARVATRRLRSDLRTFHGFLEPEWTSALREELAWLGGELGTVRDADVLLSRLQAGAAMLPGPEARSAASLLSRLATARLAARTELLASMRGPRYTRLLDRLVAAAEGPALADGAGEPAREALRGTMEGPWGHLQHAADAAAGEGTDEALHALRIRSKRARYAAEAVAPVFGKPARGFARAATALQDILGEHQDAVVAQSWLRDAAARGGARRAFAAGMLAAEERRAQAAAREAWPRAWKTLSRKRFRFWS